MGLEKQMGRRLTKSEREKKKRMEKRLTKSEKKNSRFFVFLESGPFGMHSKRCVLFFQPLGPAHKEADRSPLTGYRDPRFLIESERLCTDVALSVCALETGPAPMRRGSYSTISE